METKGHSRLKNTPLGLEYSSVVEAGVQLSGGWRLGSSSVVEAGVQISGGGWGTAWWWGLGYSSMLGARVQLGGRGWAMYGSVVDAGVCMTQWWRLGYGSVAEPGFRISNAMYVDPRTKRKTGRTRSWLSW